MKKMFLMFIVLMFSFGAFAEEAAPEIDKEKMIKVGDTYSFCAGLYSAMSERDPNTREMYEQQAAGASVTCYYFVEQGGLKYTYCDSKIETTTAAYRAIIASGKFETVINDLNLCRSDEVLGVQEEMVQFYMRKIHEK